MKRSWPVVRLGEVLKRTAETVTISPDVEYSEITVRLWGKGVVLRGIVSGVAIAGNRRFVAKPGQLILSRIDARNGAIGIVPAQLDGAVVTNDFPLFDLELSKLDAAFLGWLSKTSDFVELCKRASEGTTNRVRLQEERFLALAIPLPPLPEQRRIVAQIEELATKITEARSLREKAVEEAKALKGASAANVLLGDWSEVPLECACTLITDGTHQTPRYVEDGYIFLSAQNIKPFRFMPETHRKVSIEDYRGCQVRVKPKMGDVLLTRVGAGIGEAAVIDRDIDFAFYVSLALIRPEFNKLMPEFLVHWLNSPSGLAQSKRQTLGKGHSQGNLNLKLLRQFPLPLPPFSEQRRIVAYLDGLQTKVDMLKRLQAETAAELDALLPAVLDKAFKGEL